MKIPYNRSVKYTNENYLLQVSKIHKRKLIVWKNKLIFKLEIVRKLLELKEVSKTHKRKLVVWNNKLILKLEIVRKLLELRRSVKHTKENWLLFGKTSRF